ncbi:MAG: hypothetical protein OEY79_02485 [Anaplasmataceae bacterium]|nr:hypothetical protein [Anaplasmataceae bacterium]
MILEYVIITISILVIIYCQITLKKISLLNKEQVTAKLATEDLASLIAKYDDIKVNISDIEDLFKNYLIKTSKVIRDLNFYLEKSQFVINKQEELNEDTDIENDIKREKYNDKNNFKKLLKEADNK